MNKVILNILGCMIIATLFALCGIGVLFAVAFNQVSQDVPTITVEGKSQTVLTPDKAVFTYSVISEGIEQVVVQEQNTTKSNAILEYIKGQGVPEADIKTTSYTVEPKYVYKENEAPTIAGYTVTNMVTVDTKKIENIGTWISGVVQKGANQVSQVSFSMENDAVVRDTARQEAIKDARTRAKGIAEASGVKLGRLISVNDSGGYYPVYGDKAMAVAETTSEPVTPPTIQPGTEDITVSVTLVFEIKQ